METNEEDFKPVFMTDKERSLENKLNDALAQHHSKEIKDTNVQEILLAGPSGQITASEFHRLTKHGCSNCQKNLFPYMADTLTWVDYNSPLCPQCASDWVDNLSTPYPIGDDDF